MKPDELQLTDPACFAAIFAMGRDAGVAAERDRVEGHLTAARLSGAVGIAHAAIADGRDVAALATDYLAFGLARRDGDARQEDSDALGDALDGVSQQTSALDAAERVAQIVVDGLRSDSSRERR